MSDKTLMRIFWAGMLAASLLAGAFFQPSQASGTHLQETETGWSTPSNLSQSGGASKPHLVIDSAGRISLLWQDKYAGAMDTPGVMAAQGVDGEWSAARVMELPFGQHLDTLKLAADSNGWIYAAWINDQGGLLSSQVRGEAFTNPGSWSSPQLLAMSTADFDMATDAAGYVHYVFARVNDDVDFPAGVYALRSIGTGSVSLPRVLAASPYFRGLKADEVEVSVTAADEHVYAAWELAKQEKIFQAVSSDKGLSWGEAGLVDSRQAGDGSGVGPTQPRVQALGGDQAGSALLVWQAGHQGVSCGQYSQHTSDYGQTWSEAVRLPEPFDKSCAEELRLMAIPGGGVLAFAESNVGVNLLVWDPGSGEGRWSKAQVQTDLSGFTNPVTYRAATLGCRQAGVSAAGVLSVAGCEDDSNAAEGSSGDIWLLERKLGEVANWFPPPAAAALWSPAVVLDSETEGVNDPTLIGDSSGRMHALWSRENDSGIAYAQWDGSQWTQAQTMVNSPGGAPEGMTAIVTPDGLLAAAWGDPTAGGLFYSLATAAQASEEASWLAPQDLPLSGTPSAPQMAALADGRLALAYIQAFNEGRGIYLVESKAAAQAGQLVEWNEPQVIFAADEAGWDSLGEPRLALASDGSLTATWIRHGLPPESRSMGLYSARGTAGSEGYSWSKPEAVQKGQVAWSELLAAGSELHRAWQEVVGGQVGLFHQVSQDGGQTWSSPSRPGGASEPGQQTGMAGLGLTPSGEVNLVQINARNPQMSGGTGGGQMLQRWGWQAEAGGGGGWKELESQELTGLAETTGLSVSGGKQGLGVLFSGVEKATSPATSESGSGQGEQAGAAPVHLYYSERQLAGSPASGGEAAAAVGQATNTPAVTAKATETSAAAAPTSGPTATATFSPNPASSGLPGLGGMSGAILIGLAAAALIAGLAFLAAGRSKRY